MELTPAQTKILTNTARFRVVNCGRRFGKSTLASLEMISCAIAKKDTRVAYVANTYQQARDIVWEMLKELAREAIISVNESRLELTLRTQEGGESWITLRGWENIDTLRGLKFHFIVLDEVASMRNFWMNWQEVVRPTLTDYQGTGLFLSTPKGFNHFYELYNKEKEDKDYKSFHFTSYDNPFLPKKELNKAQDELTEDRFHQEYLGEFRKMEGLIYKDFDRKKHLFDDNTPLPQFIENLAGVDFGWTNPASVINIRKDADNCYWIVGEWYKTKHTTAQIAEATKVVKPHRVFPDPAEPDRIDLLQKEGLNVQEVSKDVKAGIDSVRKLLKENRIRVHHRCKNVIWEFETYHYKEQKNLDVNAPEEPEKKDDHAMDAIRYVLHNDNYYVEDHGEEFNLYGADYD